MNKWQAQVQQFHRQVIDGPTSPAPPKLRDAELRALLIAEEASETILALVGDVRAYRILDEVAERVRELRNKLPSLVESIDGACDLIYVALGTAEAIGVDLDPFFDEVHRSNMAKTGDSINGFGKRGGKPSGWVPPRIAEILAKVPQ